MLNNADIAVAKLPGLVSIVIPCCGMLEYTKLCVPSILKHSRPPFELIFIDIGSLDGTAEYLAGLKTGPKTREAENGRNRGESAQDAQILVHCRKTD
jgi:glycosyltransferase involved in cell wall biosynthesis